MLTKNIILILLVTIPFLMNSETSIVLPEFEYANVYYDVRDYIKIEIDEGEHIRIAGNEVDKEGLYPLLFNELFMKHKYHGLRLNISVVHLYIDKDVKYKIVDSLLLQLRKLNMHNVNLACISTQFNYEESESIKGFLHRLNTINDKVSIVDSVKSAIDYEFKNLSDRYFIDSMDVERKYVPPPPPKGINVSKLKSGDLGIPSKMIEISNSNYSIDNISFNKETLKWYLKDTYSKSPYVFVLAPTPDCTYESWMYVFSFINQMIFEAREWVSRRDYNLKFNELAALEQSIIKKKCPLAIVFNE